MRVTDPSDTNLPETFLVLKSVVPLILPHHVLPPVSGCASFFLALDDFFSRNFRIDGAVADDGDDHTQNNPRKQFTLPEVSDELKDVISVAAPEKGEERSVFVHISSS